MFSEEFLDTVGTGGTISSSTSTFTDSSSFLTGSGSAFLVPFGGFASVSIRQQTSPTAIKSPSSAFNVITPAASAGNSKVALSESTSAIA